MWFIVALFLVLTITFLSGKGGFLIAGYNTASKEEKAKYDEKKLCRVMGIGMGVITIVLAIPAILKDNTPNFYIGLMIAVIMITIIGILVVTNTICKVSNPEVTHESKEDEARSRKLTKFTLIFTLVVFAVVGVILVTGDIKVSLNDKEISIEATYWKDQTIAYKDIQSVTYSEDLSIGSRTNGVGSLRLNEGHFNNNLFGDYILYSYTKCKTYVVIKTNSDIFVVNGKSSEDTKRLYEEIREKI
ncbi:DUF3784 domain-containing protein [Clostridium sp. 'White wine YQ']|uniref:DUF3784 domain-containing protein n=1 Tax=Clostridium sp. 'White wine YQ' TaxID=3027474 RepID=UPI002365FD4F|nr:DUF3784 domain-containing protein [Clostridium sp. 'White wine YQ']MDD7794361.1 DUF3784 domain-containing protein [Clostridium sp. 'White wine YQ']